MTAQEFVKDIKGVLLCFMLIVIVELSLLSLLKVGYELLRGETP